jgi:hypothetical protein
MVSFSKSEAATLLQTSGIDHGRLAEEVNAATATLPQATVHANFMEEILGKILRVISPEAAATEQHRLQNPRAAPTVDDAMHELQGIIHDSLVGVNVRSLGHSIDPASPPVRGRDFVAHTSSADESLSSALMDFIDTATEAVALDKSLGELVGNITALARSIADRMEQEWALLPGPLRVSAYMLATIAVLVLLRKQLSDPEGVTPERSRQARRKAFGSSRRALQGEDGWIGAHSTDMAPGNLSEPSWTRWQQAKHSPNALPTKSTENARMAQDVDIQGIGATEATTVRSRKLVDAQHAEQQLQDQQAEAEREDRKELAGQAGDGARNYIAMWRNLKWMCTALGPLGAIVPNGLCFCLLCAVSAHVSDGLKTLLW